jgi:hypothetical protein
VAKHFCLIRVRVVGLDFSRLIPDVTLFFSSFFSLVILLAAGHQLGFKFGPLLCKVHRDYSLQLPNILKLVIVDAMLRVLQITH